MDANNNEIHLPISKPSSPQGILSQSLFPFSQSPRTSSVDPPPPISSLCDWVTGNVSLVQQPRNIDLPADNNSPPPIESLCDWVTGDVSLLQQPWNIDLPADINSPPPIESLCDWVTGDVSLLQQPWNIDLPADINPSPPIESLCDWGTGDVSLLQQPWNIALPTDNNPSPPIHPSQGVGTSMLDQSLETLDSPSRQSCSASRENTSFRDPEISCQGLPLSHTIYCHVSHPSVSTVAAM
ncbi:uncharacterized protein N7529_000968 [Penicillium soppii]|uniref:uncharacterized protein n=1 Tax=Penicillium soppii TaxID=69789 RepID=UPI002549BCB9|nr:uncharacterized protein N7529_000968 [Penicillium soppii]KAJ5882296.1 hypothetical protein N7529_000968 [Penicillium soppii]